MGLGLWVGRVCLSGVVGTLAHGRWMAVGIGGGMSRWVGDGGLDGELVSEAGGRELGVG